MSEYIRLTYHDGKQRQEAQQLFLLWAKHHMGQGYSLEWDDDGLTFLDPVTRWAFVAWKAARRLSHLSDSEVEKLLEDLS